MQRRSFPQPHPLLHLTKGWWPWDCCVYIFVLSIMLRLWLKLNLCVYVLYESVFV